jgi:hypothetical protein
LYQLNQPCDFFHFLASKIRVNPTDIVSSLFPPRCFLSSGRCHHAVISCHTSLLWSQDELAASASSFDNTLSHHIPSQAKTKALNPHHRRWPPSPNSPALTIHCYKKVISTLDTLHITQMCLHFTSSLARAPWHQSSTCHRHSLSSSSHVHRPSAQWHTRRWTIRPSFVSWTACMWIHVKRYFKIPQHHVGISSSLIIDFVMKNKWLFCSLAHHRYVVESYIHLFLWSTKLFSWHVRYPHHQLSHYLSIVKSSLHHLSYNLT